MNEQPKLSVDEAVAAIMARRHAASGSAVFLDVVILRDLLKRIDVNKS